MMRPHPMHRMEATLLAALMFLVMFVAMAAFGAPEPMPGDDYDEPEPVSTAGTCGCPHGVQVRYGEVGDRDGYELFVLGPENDWIDAQHTGHDFWAWVRWACIARDPLNHGWKQVGPEHSNGIDTCIVPARGAER